MAASGVIGVTYENHEPAADATRVLQHIKDHATDLGIEAAHMLRLRDRLYVMMSDYTGKSPETIHRDFDRNKWLFAEEAVEYGVADKILDRAPDVIKSVTNGDDDEKVR